MPLYEFLCKHCSTKFEELIRESEAVLAHCPQCGTPETNRLLSLFAATSNTVGKSATAPSDFGMNSGGHACGCGSCSCGSH